MTIVMNEPQTGDLIRVFGPRWFYKSSKDIHRSSTFSKTSFLGTKLVIVIRRYVCDNPCQCSLLEILYEGNAYIMFFPFRYDVMSQYESCYDV